MHSNINHNQYGQSQTIIPSSKYFKEMNDQSNYAIEYATPIHQGWNNDPSGKQMIEKIYFTVV